MPVVAPEEQTPTVATPAKPPATVEADRAVTADRFDPADLDPDFPDIDGVVLDGVTLAFGNARTLTLLRSTLIACPLDLADDATVDLQDAVIRDTDLTGRRIEAAVRTRFERCRLSGVDLGEARLVDVVFDDCSLELASARTASFERVELRGGTLDGLDLTGSTLADVTIVGVGLAGVTLDRVRWSRADLRDAELSAVTDLGLLRGVTIGEHQAIALAARLAKAAGIAVAGPDRRTAPG